MEVISENTPITLGLVIILVGFIVWLSKLHMTTASQGKQIEEIKVSQGKQIDEINHRLKDMETEGAKTVDRMARIETKIDYIIDALKVDRK